MYRAPARIFSAAFDMSLTPTFLSAAVDGLICMMPTAPAGLFLALVQSRFLVSLRNQH